MAMDRLPMLTWILFLKFLDDMEQIANRKRCWPKRDFVRRLIRRIAGAIGLPKHGITGDELIQFVNNEEAVRQDGKRGPRLFAYQRGLQDANGGDRRDVIATVFRGTINRMINVALLPRCR
jgi:type I restriction enzyme M protein